MDIDALRVPDISGQVLASLIASNIGIAVFDQWLRYRFVNDALARINGIPVQDHIGESVRKIAGEVKAEPAFRAVFSSGKVISGLEITGKLPKRSDVGHWIETYLPIRRAGEMVTYVAVLMIEVSFGTRKEVKELDQQLLERLTLNMDRTQELLLELRRLRGKYGPLRADSERIIAEIGKPASERGPAQAHGPASLSEREGEIVTFLAKGRSNKEIASTLNISVKTVETHRARIFLKLHLDSFASLVRYAIRNKMVEP